MGFDSRPKPQLVSVQKIWDHSPHNALTDLIYFNERWWCVFRESDAHVGGRDGNIRLVVSSDGVQWTSAANFSENGVDLRDPKLSKTPEGLLMLLAGGTIYRNKKYVSRQSLVAFSENGNDWSPLTPIIAPHEWLWRLTWHQDKAYGVSYRHSDPNDIKKEWIVSLFETSDGLNYHKLIVWDIPGYPSETTLRFLPSGDMVALVRREKHLQNQAWIGVSTPPFIAWKWYPATLHVGGPNFLIFEDQSMLAGGRLCLISPYGLREKTMLASMDLNEITPLILLPSGGDCSYPGMVFREGELWFSYYSSHEGRTSIYLARFKF